MPFANIKTQYENMPKTSNFGNYPTLKLSENEIALIHFLASGAEDDVFGDSALFHNIRAISKNNKEYTKSVYCPMSQPDDTKDIVCPACNGEHGIEAKKVSQKIGLWVWCYAIYHDPKLEKNKRFPIEQYHGQTFTKETVQEPIVWERGPGKEGAFIQQIQTIKGLQGTLNVSDFRITRKGSGKTDTVYLLEPENAGAPLNEKQLEIIKRLPPIMSLFTGARKWPEAENYQPGQDDMIEDEETKATDLMSMLESKPASKVFS